MLAVQVSAVKIQGVFVGSRKTYNWCGNQSIFLSEGVNLAASVTVALGMAV